MILSIVIPVYNVEKYIRQCLDSISKSEKNADSFEVVCVNDGTKDNSMSIVESFSNRYENFKIINQSNQGLSVSRNVGVEAAHGDYVWFVDSDDWLADYAVDRVLEILENNEETDIFAFPIVWKHKSGDVVDWDKENFRLTGKDYLKNGYYQTPAQRFIARRDFLIQNKLQFFPNICHEDVLWGCQILYLANQVDYRQIPLYLYRQNDQSLMHNLKIKNAYDLILVHQQLSLFADENVSSLDYSWWMKMILLVLEESFSCAWNFKGTRDFFDYLHQTKEYRNKACDDASQYGNLRWKLKCWFLKHPILNKRRRLLFS